jgi:ubiquinone biosynthesis protein
LELDFSRERQNLEQFTKNFADDPLVVIPQPYSDLCTNRVLTMDRIDGVSLARVEKLIENHLDLDDLAKRGANIFLEMIFRDGLYHADPHPGNIFVLQNSAIGLLDFGMTGRIDEQLREQFEDLLMAMADHSTEAVCDSICELGSVPRDLERADLRRDVGDFLAEYASQNLDELDLRGALNRMMEIIRSFKIVLPSRVSLLIKVLVMLEGTARGLNPKFSLAEIIQPYQSKIVRRRLSPERLARKAKQQAKAWTRLAEMAPRELADILVQLKQGQFDVHLEHRKLDAVVNRLVMGVLTAAFFVGSAMILSSQVPPLVQGVPVVGAVGCLISCGMGLRLVRAIQNSGNIVSK